MPVVIDTWQEGPGIVHGTLGLEPSFTLGQSFVAEQRQVSFGFYLAPALGFEVPAQPVIDFYLYEGENVTSTTPLLVRPAVRTDVVRNVFHPAPPPGTTTPFTLFAADFGEIPLQAGTTYSVLMNTRGLGLLTPFYHVLGPGPPGDFYAQGHAIMGGIVITDGDYAFRLVQIPEPASWSFLLLGLAIITGRRRC